MADYTGYNTIYDYLKNVEIPNGWHTLFVNGVPIDIESYNYEEDMTYGVTPELSNLNVRFIRDYLNGSNLSVGNHWVEIQAIDSTGTNVALNKPVTGSVASQAGYEYTRVTDGDSDTANYTNSVSWGLQYLDVDLQAKYSLSSIKVWHYYGDSRTFNVTKTQVSEDGITWYTVYDSAIDGVYIETPQGKTHTTFKNTINYLVGDANPDARMLILKYKKNLTILTGATVTPQVRKKGMVIYVAGTFTNNGRVSMTARGAIAPGQIVCLSQNPDGSYEYIPAIGGDGGTYVGAWSTSHTNGNPGKNGVKRGLGGGGSGGASGWRYYNAGWAYSGSGTSATSYSGGTGGGGIRCDANNGGYQVGPLSTSGANGGAGGNGWAQSNTHPLEYAGGGAGNNGGTGMVCNLDSGQRAYPSGNGQNGTGGLLIIYSKEFYNNTTGILESKGSNGGFGYGGGGASGGGSINIFYINTYSDLGDMNVDGGISASGCYGLGGAGGKGCVTKTKIYSATATANVTKRISELKIGDSLLCRYAADVSGQVGVFSALGTSSMMEISPTLSSATPNGTFKFIYFGRDYKGRMKFMADRNIQMKIPWNAINTGGFASADGLPVDLLFTDTVVPIILTSSNPNVASSSETSTNPATRLFDGKDDTCWNCGQTTGWVTYDFEEPRNIRKYSITSSYWGNYDHCPKDWTLEGSNDDGSTWIVLDTRSGITWSGTGNLTKEFFFEHKLSYKKYRLNITANNGNPSTLAIYEFKLMEAEKTMYNMFIRLPTGGVDTTDKNNEWDKVIVESDLNGTITPGDDNVWHWSNIASLTSTAATSDDRIARGNAFANYTNAPTGTAVTYNNAYVGFRPVLIIEQQNFMKYMILDGSEYKSIENGILTTIANTSSTDVEKHSAFNDAPLKPNDYLPLLSQLMDSEGKFKILKRLV